MALFPGKYVRRASVFGQVGLLSLILPERAIPEVRGFDRFVSEPEGDRDFVSAGRLR